MIARLTGTLVDHTEGRAVIDVAGVGYEVFTTNRTLVAWGGGRPVTVHVSTQVREDAITLYGFEGPDDRRAFLALLGVSGVGPRMALSALDALSIDALRQAIESDDIRALTQIPGVGKKTAQRLALELKDKLPGSGSPGASPATKSVPDPLPLALAQLEYGKSEIDHALAGLEAAGVSVDAPLGERLAAALRVLAGRS